MSGKEKVVRPLTQSDLNIIRYASLGLSNKEIAEECSVSASHVGNRMTNIYDKLRARDRAHAVAICLREGYIK